MRGESAELVLPRVLWAAAQDKSMAVQLKRQSQHWAPAKSRDSSSAGFSYDGGGNVKNSHIVGAVAPAPGKV